MVVPTVAWIIIAAGIAVTFLVMGMKLATLLAPLGWGLLITTFIFLTALLLGQHQKFIDFVDWIRRIIRERKERRYYDYGPYE